MKILDQAKKINWLHPYRRRAGVHKLDLYLRRTGPEIRRIFHMDFNNLLALADELDVQWNMDDDQFNSLGQAVLWLTLADARHGTNHIKKLKEHALKGVDMVKGWDRIDMATLTQPQLASLYGAFARAVSFQMPTLFAPLVIERQLFRHTKLVLASKYSGQRLEKLFDTVITPVEPTPITQAEIDLYAARLKSRSPKQLLAAARSHLRRHSWIGMRFVDDKPRSVESYLEQLSSMKLSECRKQIRRYNLKFKRAKDSLSTILRKFSSQERRFLRLVNEYSFLRHQRDLFRNTVYYYSHFLFHELSTRFNVPLQDLLTYTLEDLNKLLKTNQRLPQLEISSRRKHFVYFLNKGNSKLYSDSKTVATVRRFFTNLRTTEQRTSSNIRGMGSFPGIAKGTVKIIRLTYVAEDLQAVKHGQVLVAESTKPEYVLAMRRAVAVVTNEGGLTCHAAIVAREFQIPTIVGTKIATKVFKDGDKVEVDATKGIVKKI
ncbi:hypothetical protein IID19_03940 [Patescibacteria group bacterium]|nr:hypothetical protein [Patescibacteria group bacterium]